MRDARIVAMDKQCCKLYAQAFPKEAADDTFWWAIHELDLEFSEKTKDAKPLQIQSACTAYNAGFRKALMEAKKRGRR